MKYTVNKFDIEDVTFLNKYTKVTKIVSKILYFLIGYAQIKITFLQYRKKNCKFISGQ